MPSLQTSSGHVLATEARWLSHFWQRGLGWIGRPPSTTLALGIPLTEGERIHSLGVRFPLELAYCDAAGRVLQIRSLAPNRLAPPVPGARVVWELVMGGLDGVALGEVLLWH